MSGTVGSLDRSQYQPRPHGEKCTASVRRICAEDSDRHVAGDGASSSSSSSLLRKRKRENSKDDKELENERDDEKQEKDGKERKAGWIHMVDVICEGKKTLQDSESRNGVTFAFIGSSGCGKSTCIRKVFIDKIFTVRAKEDDRKEFIIQVFTESAKSDAFKNMPKNILVDTKGLDEHNINFCYHMNENYDKKYNFLFILDDVLDLQYKMLVKRMFLTMRNTNISSLVSLQYPNLVPKAIRTSVYFTLLFYLNTDEAVELAVRGWLSAYLPGHTVKEKMLYYRRWTKQGHGHQMILVDNLNHKCYLVDSEYYCKELPMITTLDYPTSGENARKRRKPGYLHPEEEESTIPNTIEQDPEEEKEES